MDVFLGRDAFSGPALEAGAVIDRFMGEARFDGGLACVNWQRSEVERVLPSELTLAENRSSAPDLHPVLFMFGGLRKTSILFGDVAIPTGVDYAEFLMAIPYVRHRRGRYLHTYMARMFSGVPTSVFVGNLYYGFGKSLACMGWEGPIFTVASVGKRQQLAQAGIGAKPATEVETRQTVANLTSLHAALSLPIVGRRTDGSLVSSYFEVDFDAGVVEPRDAWISIDAPIIAGLSPRRYAAVHAGAVRITDVMWRLSWPVRSQF